MLLIAALLILAGKKPWAKGVVLGGTASLVNLLLMAGGIPGQVYTQGARGARRAAGKYALRMMIMAATLVYAGMNDSITLGAAIPALFVTQAVLLFEEFSGKSE